MGKIIIVKQPVSQNAGNCGNQNQWDGQQNFRLLLTLFDEKRPYLMETAPLLTEEGILGSIYLARVQDVVPGLKGAFLAVSKGETVYLPLAKCQEILIANRQNPDREADCAQSGGLKRERVFVSGESLKQGDEVVVQITGEALKTKQPTASEHLSLTGQYCVCGYFGHGIHYSKKLSEEKKKEIDMKLKERDMEGRKRYQFTVRTNAGELGDLTPLFEEMADFIRVFDTLTEVYRHRTCYSRLYRKEAEILSRIKNIPLDAYDEIVTDEEDVYGLLADNIREKPVRLYKDALLPLAKLYSLETHLKEALGKRVWLPCGGYLVIEPTEAMTVIDVNSGKAVSKGKKSKSDYLTVNLEAAGEVARQLRLRNYSGMIMVDFISMEKESDNRILLEKLDRFLREDKVPARLVDMTALGIVEITRKKVSRPLADFL
ncbi:MAG: ribonuclease E/G [Lachnospiraceae bacterium]|nr:ribonuclease E/G [Lachnospiraceae bacterium]